MKTLHIIGSKNSGKTTLINFLIEWLSARGYRIGAWKHSSHTHPLDKPGSDSDTFRRSGALPVVFESGEGCAVFFNPLPESEKSTLLRFVFKDCDLVLIESFSSASGPKIMVSGGETDINKTENILAVVNREGKHAVLPAFKPRSEALGNFVIKKLIEKEYDN